MMFHTPSTVSRALLPLAALLWLSGCADLTRVKEFRAIKLAKPAARAITGAGAIPGLPSGVKINRKAGRQRPPGVNQPPRGAARPKRGG